MILGGPGPPTVALPDILSRRPEPLSRRVFCLRHIQTDCTPWWGTWAV